MLQRLFPGEAEYNAISRRPERKLHLHRDALLQRAAQLCLGGVPCEGSSNRDVLNNKYIPGLLSLHNSSRYFYNLHKTYRNLLELLYSYCIGRLEFLPSFNAYILTKLSQYAGNTTILLLSGLSRFEYFIQKPTIRDGKPGPP
jgi:hypothetical protein